MKKIFLTTAILTCMSTLVLPHANANFDITNSEIQTIEENWISVSGVSDGKILFDETTGSIYDAEQSITTLNIPSTINGVEVVEIKTDAFRNLTNITSATIPDTVISIGDTAFANARNLEEITLSENLKTIGNNAFLNCYNLKTIKLPKTLTSLGEGAFASCTSLDNIEIPAGIKTIKPLTFKGNSSLENIVLNEGLTHIETNAFANCTSIKEIILPNSLYSIETSAFSDCSALLSITIPENVEKLNYSIFSNCINLKEINVDSNNSNFVSIDGVLFDSSKILLIEYPAGKEDTSYFLPTSVIALGNNSFSNVTYLKNLNITHQLLRVYSDVFLNSQITITSFSGSNIETYAKENGINFISTSVSENVSVLAVPTPSKIFVNGIEVPFTAYKIDGNNYFKLRDIALVVNGTNKNFEVTWESETNSINLISNKAYTSVGSELETGVTSSQTAVTSPDKTYVDGVFNEFSIYQIEGYNYFKLRDICSVFDIGVTYDNETQNIGIDTSISYQN